MTCKLWILAAAALALGLAQGPALAQQYGPPTSGPSAAILFVPAVLNPVAGFNPANGHLNGQGYGGDGSLANSSTSQFDYPVGEAYDSNGNLFIADQSDYIVRRIDHSTGDLSTFAGTPQTFGFSPTSGTAMATNAKFGLIAGLVIDSKNNVYVSDRSNNVIWMITPGGTISIFAGNGASPSTCTGSTDSVGDGCSAINATFSNPWALGIDASNNIYIADSYNDLVREVSSSTGKISIFAGDVADAGSSGSCNASSYSVGGPGPYLATQAHLCFPEGIAFDSSGNAYITDSTRNEILIVNSSGYVSVFAGGGSGTCANAQNTIGDGCPATDATFHTPAGAYVDPAGRFYTADFFNAEIRMVDSTGNITDVMGNTHGSLNATSLSEPDTEAVFNSSSGQYSGALDGAYDMLMDPYGNLIVTDSSGDVITSAGGSGGGSYYFGNQQIYATVTTTSLNAGSSFYPPYILISNPSGVTLNFTGTPTVTTLTPSATPQAFAIAGGTCTFPGSLAPGASCTMVVSFTPTIGGSPGTAYTGTITFDSNSNSSPNTIYLSGAGTGVVYPSATLLPNPVPNFTSPAGVTSAVQDVTLTNTGVLPLTIGGTDFDGTSLAYFEDAGTTCPTSPATLGAGDSCYYQITFTPTAATTYTAGFQVDITTQSYGYLSTYLSGTGTPNTLTATLTPSPLAFGGLVPGQTSLPMVATLSNNSSTTAVTGITPTLTGTNPGDFAITTGTNACGATLAASASCYIYVTFKPASAASFSATLSVADNAANTPQTASLTGTGVSFVSNVGTLLAAQLVTVPITTAGTLSSIQVLTQGAANLDFTETSGGTCATTTAYTVGETCTVNVIFKPRVPGARPGAVLLTDASNDILGVAYLPGTGIGPQIAFNPGVQSTLPSYSGESAGEPYGVAVDAGLNVYIADNINNWIIKMPWTGSAYGTPVQLPFTGLDNPHGVAVDGTGDVFVADTYNFRIVELPWNGSSYGTQIVLDSNGLNDPTGVAVDGHGNLFFTNIDISGSALIELPWMGSGYGSPTTITAATGLSGPFGLAVDANLNIYIADTDNNRVVEIPWNGTSFGTETVVDSGLTEPEAVAVDGGGDVYIANTDASTIVEVPWNGTAFGTQVTAPFSLGVGAGPVGIAVDGYGNLYVSNDGYKAVDKLNVSTPPSLSFANTNVGSVSTDSPQTVAVSNIGNASLTFSLSTDPAYPTDFPENSSGTGLCVAASPLAQGGSCNVSVNFKPTTTGSPLSEDVLLTDNDLNVSAATQSIAVSGTATGAGPIAQTINFTQPGTPVTYSSGLTIPLVATGGASGNPVVFTIDGSSTGAGSISGSTLNVTGVGTFVIDANQAGNSTYSAAPQVQRSVIVNQASQTINFTQPTTPVTYSSGLTIPLVATGGASGSPVVFTIDGSSTASGSISGSTLTVTSTGTLVIDANQAGNTNYSAAPQVQRTIVVNTLLAQAINFTQPATPVTYATGLTIPLAATGGASGNPVVFSIDGSSTGAGTISGSTLNVTSVGSFVIDANQAGNSTYSAAPQVQRTVVVAQAGQVINFTQPTTPVTYSSGLQITLSATGGASGNPVVFTVDGSSTATGTISGSTVTVTSTGNLVIDANQAGNADYSAAAQVQRSITVNAPAPDFSVAATPPAQTVQPGASATYPITVGDVGSSFTGTVTLSVSGLPTGATGTFSPPTVTPGSTSGSSTLTVTTPALASVTRPNFWPMSGPVLALLFMLPIRRWRKTWRGKLLLLVAGLASLAGASSLTGCGGGFGFNQSRTYTLTVTGTSGADTHSTTVQLTVQ
ncbi:MAG: choice-of-anchor D domain-containing protein [Terracidiphilus sp.]